MLKIATFNIQNNYKLYSLDKTNDIYKFLKEEKIDILCLQEVFDKCNDDLCKKLGNSYDIFGKYRYKLWIFKRINEKNPIIAQNAYMSKTYYLPYLPSFLKRIVTKVNVKTEYGEVAVYNTHLDYKFDFVKKRQ